MSCLFPEDLLNYKYRCQTIQLCCDEETIQAALDAAQELVESYTGQKYCQDGTCIFLDGRGSRALFLTEIVSLPLTELTSISILEYGKSDIEVDLDEIHLENHTVRYKSNKCFPCGDRNIKVCGTFGIPLPEGLKAVIITLALEALSPGAAGIQPSNGVFAAEWSDFNIRYQVDQTFRIIRKTTGFRQLDNVLEAYINPMSQVMFGIVDSCKDQSCDTGCNNGCS